jgi:hypothetical protein
MTTRSLASRLLLPIFHSKRSGIWTSASIRGLHPPVHRRTPCVFSRRSRTLAHHLRSRRKRLAQARTSYAFGVTRSLDRAPGSPTALAYAAPTSTPARAAGSRTAQRSPSTRTSGLSPPHRVGELVRKASTHISFDPVTEHIASEMRLVLCSDTGKAGVLCGACLDLPSAACLQPARPPTPEWRGMAGPAPKPIRKPGAALLACSRLIRRTAYPSDVGGAEQRSRHRLGSRRTR